MSSRTSPSCRSRMPLALLLFCLFVLYMLLCAATTATAATARHIDETDLDDFCAIDFADSYFASIATTMTIAHRFPVAQTGHLYVDRSADAVRIDQFFRNHRTTFLLDNRRLRAYLFYGERDFQPTASTPPPQPTTAPGAASEVANDDEGEGGRDGVQHRCHVFYLPRRVAPFCVPLRYTVDTQEPYVMVRGVPTTRFTGAEKYPDMPVVEQSFYVVNRTALADGDDEEVAASSALLPPFTPWRLEYCARPDLERRQVAPAPYTSPNWRFFGHPMFDEIALSTAQERQLQRWEPSTDVMTVDFYDFYPTEHAASVFEVPPQCTALLRSDASRRATNESSDAETTTSPLPQLQLLTIQRFLLQWHVLHNMSGNNNNAAMSSAADL